MSRILFAVAVILAASTVAKAQVEIAAVGVVTTGTSPDFDNTASLTNLTSVTLTITDYYLDGSSHAYTLSPNTVGPESSLANALTCLGACDEFSLSLSGTLSSLDFFIGSQEYQAASLDWMSQSYNGAANETVMVDIDATPISSVSEPPSLFLFLGGMILAWIKIFRAR